MNKAAIFALLLTPVATQAAESSCQSIDDQLQRLACYDQAAEAIANCQLQQDRLDRLVCFDKLSGTTAATLNPAPVTVAPPAAAASSPQSAEQQFGLIKKADENEPEQIQGTITKMSKDAYGKFTITLDNGQSWKQTESRNFRLDKQATITISKAALGSFLLTQEGRNGSVRVKRVH
ncbi:hypothetical protein SAMN04488540_101231 [Ferrimonas sediminum]|uniref:Uncharacterized protein n=1 Tax=Ferrimonas sediminum TaxID=718193 RepID=A0A1G8K2F2_9GAMM|nr:hypothetical protein [Ferrimonas sediminum]SDI37547.1 hypothetical protein SAMN04488540_101231 [Ferrimonas sediminum]